MKPADKLEDELLEVKNVLGNDFNLPHMIDDFILE
jgi:hypothetical protein